MIRNAIVGSILLIATTEDDKLKEHPIILLPVAIRLLAFISMPVFHHFFHKGSHGIIHAIGHHCKWLTYKWVPDTLMIGSLVILQIFVG